VRDLEAALRFWRDALGLPVEKRALLPDQGVEVALLSLANSRIELLQPIEATNSIGRFIERRGEAPHHICFTTHDIEAEMTTLRARGVELTDEAPREGISGRVCFMHPQAHRGVLVELVETPDNIDELENTEIKQLPLLKQVTASVLDVREAVAAWRRAIGFEFQATGLSPHSILVWDIQVSLFPLPGNSTAVGLLRISLALSDIDAKLKELHDLGVQVQTAGVHERIRGHVVDHCVTLLRGSDA
jgi:methylmalonyl-CoA/ethylmalonyl-CoA epimerase